MNIDEMKIHAKKIEQINWKSLIDIQGDVKQITPESMEKMIKSLEKNGFCDPFIFWKNPASDEKICLAGNQRLKALKEMENAGKKIPAKLPGIPIPAKSEKQARKILLSLASTFGEVQQDELDNFIEISELDPVEIQESTNFVEILDKDPDEKAEKPIKADVFIEYLKLPFTKDDIPVVHSNLELALKKLDKTDGVSSESDVVMYLLNKFLELE